MSTPRPDGRFGEPTLPEGPWGSFNVRQVERGARQRLLPTARGARSRPSVGGPDEREPLASATRRAMEPKRSHEAPKSLRSGRPPAAPSRPGIVTIHGRAEGEAKRARKTRNALVERNWSGDLIVFRAPQTPRSQEGRRSGPRKDVTNSGRGAYFC